MDPILIFARNSALRLPNTSTKISNRLKINNIRTCHIESILSFCTWVAMFTVCFYRTTAPTAASPAMKFITAAVWTGPALTDCNAGPVVRGKDVEVPCFHWILVVDDPTAIVHVLRRPDVKPVVVCVEVHPLKPPGPPPGGFAGRTGPPGAGPGSRKWLVSGKEREYWISLTSAWRNASRSARTATVCTV